MPRFFIRQNQIEENVVKITGDDARHISRSLRMAAGEEITVCDMQGVEYNCVLESFEDDFVGARILSSKPSENEPLCTVKLFQALPKGDKLDSVIQKAVECGVREIVPFESERCVVRIKNDAEDKKRARRARIAEEAAKQCGRSVIPEVSASVGFDEMLRRASAADVCYFCYEGDGTEPLGKLLSKINEFKCEKGCMPEIAVVIGSEGGFSLAEVEKAKEAGCLLTGLGKRILRTETAPVFVLSSLVCFTELM
jgi:16S rRNA (uracil1498-N3)-methyltransferase